MILRIGWAALRSTLARHWPLLPILAVALLLRLYRLDACALWTDELFSLQSSAGRGFWVEELPRGVVMEPAARPTSLAAAAPVWDVYEGQATDTNPPLYYMVLRLWREAFGDSVDALRSLSVIATLGTVAAMYAAGAAMGGRGVAALAASLACVSATQIIYAHEVRGYAMAAAFAAVAGAAVLRIQRDGCTRARGAMLGASAALAVCTVYLAAMPVLAVAIHAGTQLRGAARRKTLIAGGAAAAVTLLAIGPLLAQQRHYLGLRNQWLKSDGPREIGAVAREGAIDVIEQVAPLQQRSGDLAGAMGCVLLAAAVPLYIWVPGSRLWLVWIALSMGALVVMDLSGDKTHLQKLRYTMLTGPGVFGLVASLATVRVRGAPLRWGWLVPWAVVLFGAVGVPAAYERERGMKEDWTILQKFEASSGVRADDLWVMAAYGGRRWDHILYLGTSRHARTPRLAAAILDDPRADLAAVRAEVEKRGRVVLFLEVGSPPPDIVPPAWHVQGRTLFPTVGMLTLYAR
jgi:hypothetical protein